MCGCIYHLGILISKNNFRYPALSLLCLTLLRKGLLLILELDQQPGNHSDFLPLFSKDAGDIGVCMPMTVFLLEFWGFEFRALCLYSKPLAHQVMSLAQSLRLILYGFWRSNSIHVIIQQVQSYYLSHSKPLYLLQNSSFM